MRRHGGDAVHLFRRSAASTAIRYRPRSPTASSASPPTCRASTACSTSTSTPADARKLTYGDVFCRPSRSNRASTSNSPTRTSCSPTSRCGKGVQGAVAACEPAPSAAASLPRPPTTSATAGRCRPTTSASREPHLQPARRAGRDLRHRAAELYPARAELRRRVGAAWLKTEGWGVMFAPLQRWKAQRRLGRAPAVTQHQRKRRQGRGSARSLTQPTAVAHTPVRPRDLLLPSELGSASAGVTLLLGPRPLRTSCPRRRATQVTPKQECE